MSLGSEDLRVKERFLDSSLTRPGIADVIDRRPWSAHIALKRANRPVGGGSGRDDGDIVLAAHSVSDRLRNAKAEF